MSADTSSVAEWHAGLADRDRAVHGSVAGRAAPEEEGALQERLSTLMAELRTARAAVAARDEIIRDQAARLTEPLVHDLTVTLSDRTEELRRAQADVAAITATRTWLWSRKAARVVSAVRRRARR